MDIDDLLKLVTVTSDEECDKADFVVCATTGFFDDDIHAACAHCGASIVHRPYVPPSPPKICLDCWMLQVGAEALPHA